MKFTNVKKWLAMLLAVCSMLSLVACGKSDKDSAGDDSEKATKVAVVFASSGLGDKSFNDALYDGMKKAESTMGIQWVYSEPKDDAEYEGLISGYADSGDCDLIICLGGSQSSSLENVAPNYPQQKFVILDAVVEGDNIRSYTWRDQELGFLAGFLGASLSDTNTLGFIGAHDIPLCNLGAAGMIAGAHYANPDCQVLVDYANGWAEVNGCYELATSMHEQGASLLYHTASAGGLGILNAGKEKNFLTIFFDGNLNADAPQTNIASAIRDFPACAQEAIQEVIDGKFTAGAIEKGLAENSLYLDFDGSAYQIPADVMEKYNAAVAAIKKQRCGRRRKSPSAQHGAEGLPGLRPRALSAEINHLRKEGHCEKNKDSIVAVFVGSGAGAVRADHTAYRAGSSGRILEHTHRLLRQHQELSECAGIYAAADHDRSRRGGGLPERCFQHRR